MDRLIRSGLFWLCHQHRYHRRECVLRNNAHLLVRSVLNGVFHKHFHRGKAQRFRLRQIRLAKLFRQDITPGNTAAFKIHNVMQTARRARASIGERFYYRIAFGGYLLSYR